MDVPAVIVPEDDFYIPSDLPPGQAEKRAALAFALGVVAVFFIVFEFSDNGPHPLPGFVLAFSTAMFVCDVIAAILLFAQFVILRSPSLLFIANGYVFTALILVPYTLTFPGLIGTGPLVGGLQSAAIAYVAWHAGFPAFVLGYALSRNARDPGYLFSRNRVPIAIVLSIAATATIVAAITLLCIAGDSLLPVSIKPDGWAFTPIYLYVAGMPAALSGFLALFMLWRKRRSRLDLWLIVVLFLYAIDIPLSYYPAPTRFSVGWYSIRAIAFLSSTIVLAVLLHEFTMLYARLFRAIDAQRREREARLRTGDMVAAMIAHEIRQPLAAMVTRSETGARWLDRPAPDIQKAIATLRQITADGNRAAAVIETIRTNFRIDAGRRTSIDANELIAEVIRLVSDDLSEKRVILDAEPNERRPKINGDRVQLQQVLLNLVTNAIDAMKTKDGPRILGISSSIHDNGDVVLSVADTGTGIDPQHMERIFNPLFTTKSAGMGMGLSICRSIIEGHGGTMWVVPNEPEGSIFAFKLLAEPATLTGAPVADGPDQSQIGPTIASI